MIPNGSVEQSLLQVRIGELERRLERLEAQLEASRPPAAEKAAQPSPARTAGTNGISAPEPAHDGAVLGEPEVAETDEGLEGARLVAIELLSAGYKREEVVVYLRSTFGIDDVDSVLAGTGLVPG